MKNVFYFFIKNLLFFYNNLYFRKVIIYGKENIPDKGGVLYSPNHQGAFLDPLLIGTLTPRKITSLTRSDVFGGPMQWFMDALNMIPVYRIRNGYSNLKNNTQTFDKCFEILRNSGNLLMFSEGSHHNEYFLQKLSKGSSRLAYQAQQRYPEESIWLQPVGINYGHHQLPRCTLHLVFGRPILVKDCFNPDLTEAENVNLLREELQLKMKECLWLPNNDTDYLEKKKFIHKGSTTLDFHTLKKELAHNTPNLSPKKEASKVTIFVASLLGIFNFAPLLLTKKVIQQFEDIVFHASLKYVIGLFIFPLWWLFVGILLYVTLGTYVALAFVGLAILSIFLRNDFILT